MYFKTLRYVRERQRDFQEIRESQLWLSKVWRWMRRPLDLHLHTSHRFRMAGAKKFNLSVPYYMPYHLFRQRWANRVMHSTRSLFY